MSNQNIKKKVVIVGAGYAGMAVYDILASQFTTVVIDTKDFFEHTVSMPLVIANNRPFEKLAALHTTARIKPHEFVHGKAVELLTNAINVQTPQGLVTIDFDFCFIATGSFYPSSIKAGSEVITFAERKKEIGRKQQEVENASRIFIRGAASVGLELAAECRQKGKEVIVVSRSGVVLPRLNKAAQTKAKAHLEKAGVKFILEKDMPQDLLSTDLVFDCTGIYYPKREEHFLYRNFEGYLDEKSRIRVNDFLQICDANGNVSPNIFAAGDAVITKVDEEKVARLAAYAAEIAAKNIKQLGPKGKGPSAFKKFHQTRKDVPELYVVLLGKKSMFVNATSAYIAGIFTGLKMGMETSTLKKYLAAKPSFLGKMFGCSKPATVNP